MLNNRGQLNDVMIWMIATIIIIVLLVIFVYSSDILGKANSVRKSFKEITVQGDSEKKVDFFNEKTLIAYQINSNNKQKIDVWRENEN